MSAFRVYFSKKCIQKNLHGANYLKMKGVYQQTSCQTSLWETWKRNMLHVRGGTAVQYSVRQSKSGNEFGIKLKDSETLEAVLPFLYLGYNSSLSTCSTVSSTWLAAASAAVSSTWANMSAVRASSSRLLTFCTRSSCFLRDTDIKKKVTLMKTKTKTQG